MTVIYFKLALVDILPGCAMLAAGLGLHWLGAAAILVGVVSLALGTGDLRRNRPTPPEPAARDPYTAEDFYSPPCYPRRARSPSTACRFTSTRTPMVRTL